MKKRQYYKVGNHLFSVSQTLDPSYEPFRTQAGRPIFDVKIKMERYHGKLKHKIIRQVEDDVEITAGRIGFKFYFEFRLFKRRVAVLLTDARYKWATLIVEEFPKFSIDSGLMVMYALSTANKSTLLFHSSVVMEEGYAYMFLGKSGTGKSTHSRLWLEAIKGTMLLNDDNPIVRTYPGGRIYVYGSPWSGKTHCYKNDYGTLGGIVMLGPAKVNKITVVDEEQAYRDIITSVSGTAWNGRIRHGQHLTAMKLLHYVPFYHLMCRPDHEAAKVCYDSVRVYRKEIIANFN